MISKPRTALGGGLLAAVLLASGCQARVGSAATVGDAQISTKTLNIDLRGRGADQLGQGGRRQAADAGPDAADPARAVPPGRQEARPLGAPGRDRRRLPERDRRRPAPTGPASPTSSTAYQAEELSAVVARHELLLPATKKVDAVDLYAVPVADQATADQGAGRCSRPTPQDAAAIAAAVLQQRRAQGLGRARRAAEHRSLGMPALATVPLNRPTIQTVGGAPRRAPRPGPARLRCPADGARRPPKVKVNPRFGAWGTDTDHQRQGVIPVGQRRRDTGAAPAASAAPSASGRHRRPRGCRCRHRRQLHRLPPPPAAASAAPLPPTAAPSATAATAPSATAAPSSARSLGRAQLLTA